MIVSSAVDVPELKDSLKRTWEEYLLLGNLDLNFHEVTLRRFGVDCYSETWGFR